jgi:glycosyltransferase involved in cell wall biosynthesis
MKKHDTPILTIAVTTFNRWDQCAFALESIVRQDFQDFHLLLVDDASSTRPPRRVQRILDSVDGQYIRHLDNLGLACTRNSAIAATTSRFIAFCDDDDCWPVSMAGDLVGVMLDAPTDVEVGLLLTVARKRPCSALLGSYPRLSDLMALGVTPPVSANIFAASAVQGVGGYRPKIRSGVDHDIWISLLKRDTRAAVVWGVPPATSRASRGRMTRDEAARRAGIGESLRIWREDLSSQFGDDFVIHFEREYERHLNRSFLAQDIKGMRVLSCLRRVIHQPNLLGEVIRLVWRTLVRSPCTSFASFRTVAK